MDVVVQRVDVHWTKASRGGEGATRRNAVRTAYPLPRVGAPLLHHVVVDEATGFEVVETVDAEPGLGEATGLWLRTTGDGLRVEIRRSPSGAPVREHRPPVVHLAPGEWLRWRVNYRYSGYSTGWWYADRTIAVAHGPVDADTFLGVPTRSVDERVHLF